MHHSITKKRFFFIITWFLIGLMVFHLPSYSQEKKSKEPKQKLEDKVKEIAGSAEFLRSVPKHFATLKAVDEKKHQVTLLIEGEVLPKVWNLVPDAEIKTLGWWGRLSDFTIGDRVWVWFKTNRQKQAVAISMLADEISEQDIHGNGVTVKKTNKDSLTVIPAKGKERVLKSSVLSPEGPQCYVQSAGESARLVLDKMSFADRQQSQKMKLRSRWLEEGLPGTVAVAHVFSGEMDLLLDHETMRWARSLNSGDKVTLKAQPPIKALVKSVQPWRERTLVRLVVHSFDLADISVGDRLGMIRTPPPVEVDTASYPPDLDRARTTGERVEWFLASTYCSCRVMGDVCTGHFYTLASCNPNGCAMPHLMRKNLQQMIEKGLTDRQIFEDLVKNHGAEILRPHLLP